MRIACNACQAEVSHNHKRDTKLPLRVCPQCGTVGDWTPFPGLPLAPARKPAPEPEIETVEATGADLPPDLRDRFVEAHRLFARRFASAADAVAASEPDDWVVGPEQGAAPAQGASVDDLLASDLSCMLLDALRDKATLKAAKIDADRYAAAAWRSANERAASAVAEASKLREEAAAEKAKPPTDSSAKIAALETEINALRESCDHWALEASKLREEAAKLGELAFAMPLLRDCLGDCLRILDSDDIAVPPAYRLRDFIAKVRAQVAGAGVKLEEAGRVL